MEKLRTIYIYNVYLRIISVCKSVGVQDIKELQHTMHDQQLLNITIHQHKVIITK